MNEMKARGVPRPVVAVVTGATGAVGAAAVRELTRGLEPGDTLVLVGRSGDRLKALQGEANAENPTLAVWLEELSLPVGGGPGEISEAVSVVLNRIAKHPAASGAVAGGSAVLLNAIGPSASMSIPLAAAALCAGFHVVDPGGSDRVIGGVDGSARAGARAALFGAGVQPGLTGMMMGRAVLLAGNPAESRVTILVGGRQRLTRSTLDEYLSSLSADGGWPGAIWRGGRVLCGHGSSEVAIPGYVPPKGATVSVHLDEEYAHRAGALGVGELRAANLMDAPQTVSAMRRWVAGEMTADVVAEVSAQEVAQTASDAAGKTPWFGIDVHVIGATGLEVCARFRCEDSYAASGMAAAQAARAVVGRGTIGAIAPGAHWASATAAADSWAAWPEVTISCERREQQPGGIAVIGAGFGAHYARALVGAPRARLSCIGGRGGPCGRALAEELGVTYVSLEDASIPSRERLPGALVGAVVAVRSEIVGGRGGSDRGGFSPRRHPGASGASPRARHGLAAADAGEAAQNPIPRLRTLRVHGPRPVVYSRGGAPAAPDARDARPPPDQPSDHGSRRLHPRGGAGRGPRGVALFRWHRGAGMGVRVRAVGAYPRGRDGGAATRPEGPG